MLGAWPADDKAACRDGAKRPGKARWSATIALVLGCSGCAQLFDFDKDYRDGDASGEGGRSNTDDTHLLPGSFLAAVEATVAECIDPERPDPALCEERSGAGMISVDAGTDNPPHPFWIFLRFDVDPAIAGRGIDQVKLQLVVGPNVGNDSIHTGEVRKVRDFVRDELDTSAPSRIGEDLLGPDLGAVSRNELVEWVLPGDLVPGGGIVCLGIYPSEGASDDGIDYIKQGEKGPRLKIIYR